MEAYASYQQNGMVHLLSGTSSILSKNDMLAFSEKHNYDGRSLCFLSQGCTMSLFPFKRTKLKLNEAYDLFQ